MAVLLLSATPFLKRPFYSYKGLSVHYFCPCVYVNKSVFIFNKRKNKELKETRLTWRKTFNCYQNTKKNQKGRKSKKGRQKKEKIK